MATLRVLRCSREAYRTGGWYAGEKGLSLSEPFDELIKSSTLANAGGFGADLDEGNKTVVDDVQAAAEAAEENKSEIWAGWKEFLSIKPTGE